MNYSGKVYVNLEKRSIEAKLVIHVTKETPFEELIFYLPRETDIKSIYSDDMIYYETTIKRKWSPFIAGDKELCLRFSKKPKIMETTIRMHYKTVFEGLTAGGMSLVTDDYMEVGLYVPWFPLSIKIEPSTFDVQLLGNSIYFIGGYTKESEDRWYMKGSEAAIGYPIIASSCFRTLVKTVHESNGRIRIFWTPQVDASKSEKLGDYITAILNLYTTKFGAADNQDLDILLTPRKNTDSGGGYCRPGLIVVPCGENSSTATKYNIGDEMDYLFRYLAHELAHLWWNKAAVMEWNNWLKESFAEYSCLQAFKILIDKDRYEEMMADYGKQTQELGAIYKCTVFNKDYFSIWYMKGPYILYKLEEHMGTERFDGLLKAIHEHKITQTKDIYRMLDPVEKEYFKTLIES